MWIKLDFTPLFIGGLLIGLVLVAIGLSIRLSFARQSYLGIFIVAIGAIPVLVCSYALAADRISKWREERRNRISIEQLPEDREIQGIRLPRGTKVEWHGKAMSSVTLAQPLTVLGIPLEGELKFVNTFSTVDTLVATELETATLATGQTIDGVPCKAHREVGFFRATAAEGDGRIPKATVGKLRHCTPSATFEFRGNRYLADTGITLNYLDRIERGVLAADQEVDSYWCKQGTAIERPEKRATRFTLARDQTVSGIVCKAGEEVVIEPAEGRVRSAVLAHDQLIGGIPCRGGEAVGFEYRDGAYALDSCVINRAVTILDVNWPAGSKLRGLSMDWLEVTLPPGSRGIAIGEVKAVGRCRINFDKTPPVLTGVTALDGGGCYVELRGAHFTGINVYQGEGWGHLSEPASMDGIAYEKGALVRFKMSAPK